MGIVTILAVSLGARRERDPVSGGTPSTSTPSAPPTPASGGGSDGGGFDHFYQFAAVMEALHKALAGLHQKKIKGLKAMDPRFGCKISRIEIRPLNEGAKETLQELFDYIKSDAIAERIRREILPKIPGHCFDLLEVGISPKYEGVGQSPAKDTLLEELIGPAATKNDDCMVAFDWEGVALAAPSGDVAGIKGWRLHDAQGDNPIPLKSLPFPGQKLVLGKDGDAADIVVDGNYTSGAHGWLWLDYEARWWYQDTGSTNGSRVHRPGQRDWVSPGRSSGSPATPVELTPGATLVFAAEPRNETPSDYPKLVVAGNIRYRGTPLNVGAGAATSPTPVVSRNDRPTADHSATAIRIEDVDGTRTIPVHADGLPFTVGRSQDLLVQISDKHRSVSGNHLEVRAFESGGLRIRILGRNDASLAGKPMKQGDEAIWRWGEALVLVKSPMEGEPVCRLTLQRAAGTE